MQTNQAVISNANGLELIKDLIQQLHSPMLTLPPGFGIRGTTTSNSFSSHTVSSNDFADTSSANTLYNWVFNKGASLGISQTMRCSSMRSRNASNSPTVKASRHNPTVLASIQYL